MNRDGKIWRNRKSGGTAKSGSASRLLLKMKTREADKTANAADSD
jgi:hypothetical protein